MIWEFRLLPNVHYHTKCWDDTLLYTWFTYAVVSLRDMAVRGTAGSIGLLFLRFSKHMESGTPKRCPYWSAHPQCGRAAQETPSWVVSSPFSKAAPVCRWFSQLPLNWVAALLCSLRGEGMVGLNEDLRPGSPQWPLCFCHSACVWVLPDLGHILFGSN